MQTDKTKPFKTFNEQLDLMISRGLEVKDRKYGLKILAKINYYRLSAYSLTVRENDRFYTGTKLENIVELYYFDAELRNIIMRYTPYVENSFRTYVSYYHSGKYGPLGYLDSCNFKDKWYHAKFVAKLRGLINRSDDIFIKHHRKDLGDVYPLWVAIEVTTFDMISKLYKNMLNDDQTLIAKQCSKASREYVANWLQISVFARNISAHGGRFYNRDLTYGVTFGKNSRGRIEPKKVFAYIFAIYNLLPSQSTKDRMIIDLDNNFKKHPFALKKHLGFPDDWETILLNNFKNIE
ncbi:MAG: Abi family protein [Ethanoligenens sp.]